ncbi:MAG: lysine--tRNA ligase [Candidatus Lokiarchaeota archaeon]|nr:lysine--tRNA ligase [Candidatus Lokiarchaeota archaeon]
MVNKGLVHWLEETVQEISKRNLTEITLSTGKTPSGHVHIGILREIIICDALRRIFEKKGVNVSFYLFMDDFDAAKRFPYYIDENYQKSNLGKPFALIPCPYEDCGCESYAYHFGNELISTFKYFGIKNEIIWTYNLYQRREMQDKIKTALENTDKIKEILKKYILPTLDNDRKELFNDMQKTWIPVMAICDKCNKIQDRAIDGSIQPNRAIKYLKKEQMVIYECPACGYRERTSIYSGRLKLNWRIDWPAKWALFKATCEPAGKDHSVKGGAYDTGIEICQKIYDYEGPIKLPYEWLRLGEQDMGTSKGIVFTPKKYLELADPEIYRMLILRTNPMKHISLRIEEISQYHDYYEKMENIFYGVEEPESKEEYDFYKYLYPLTKINKIPEFKPLRIPLKLLTFLSQMQNILSIEKLYEKANSSLRVKDHEKPISIKEFKGLLERTEKWIDEVKYEISRITDQKIKRNILNKIDIFTITDTISMDLIQTLSDKQLEGFILFKNFLLENDNLDADSIQNTIFTIAKEELDIPPRKMFEALYLMLLDNKSGPRLGPFILMLDKDWLLNRLDQLEDKK